MAAAFQLKTYVEVLANMFATAKTLLGADIDLNRGSFLRTIFEVCALQDADQYVQMARLLDLTSLDNAKGDDLDRKAQEYGSDIFTSLRRKAAKTSITDITVSDGAVLTVSRFLTNYAKGVTTFDVATGTGTGFPASGNVVLERGTEREEKVIFTRVGDTFTLLSPAQTQFAHKIGGEVLLVAVKSTLASGVLIGGSSATLATGTGAAWASSGSAIFERDTARREILTFTRVGDVLTLGGTFSFDHAADSDVTQATNGSDRTIALGTSVYAPATEGTRQVSFTTIEAGSLLDGDLTSDLIQVESDSVGLDTRVGSNTITQFGTAPFANAVVTNPLPATRGAEREEDDDYRFRIRDFIQSLSRATPLAIQTLTAGLRDESSNQEVAFTQVVEPVSPGESLLYISDGSTTFALDQEIFLGRDVIIGVAEDGDRRGRLSKYAPFAKVTNPVSSRTPRLFISNERGVATSVGVDFLEDTSKALTPGAFVGQYLKTDDDQFYEITANTAIRYTLDAGGATPSLGSYSVIDFTANPLEPDVDFAFNEATGDLELDETLALVENDSLVAADDNASPGVGAYTHTLGLGAYVQRKVNGDPTDFENFPGIRAAGTKVRVVAPTIVSPSFQIQVVADRGVSDAELAPIVTVLVVTYVNSLGIGENVVRSEIVRIVKSVTGVSDVAVVFPTNNVVVLSGQMARITEDYVTIL